MSYAERAYFEGDHCQHCADRDEVLRLELLARRHWQQLRAFAKLTAFRLDHNEAEQFGIAAG